MLKKIVLGMVAVILAAFAIYKCIPIGKSVDPLVYFDEFKNNQNNLVYEDQRIPLKEPVFMIDHVPYVSYEFAKQYISDTIFYDNREKVLTLTNAREVLRLGLNTNKAQLNFQTVNVEHPVKEVNHVVYLPSDLISKRYGVTVSEGADKRVFVADDKSKQKQSAVIKRKASLRTHPKNRTTVVETLRKGQKVTIYKEEDGFLRVRSENGIVGFITKGDVKHIKQIEVQQPETISALPVARPLKGKVKLIWDQLGSKTSGDWNSHKYTNINGANVISPTWFEFEDKFGNLKDRGTREYVLAAKERNLQVWPLISHNFDNPALTKEVLSSTKKRQHVINQIVKKAEEYGYEGINVDIENIQPEISDVWVEFMRELFPQLKEMGLTVSVDVYMPSNWSNHYERGKIADVCDFFIVMAYDQHWSGSETAGSVAELPWVEEGIQRNLEEVPKEKLVLGIPFYTRIWEEDSSGLKVRSYGMKPAEDIVKKWGVIPVLDEASGQKYAETEKNSVLYKVWLEDENSIKKRINLVNKYQLAGYGAWKLGLETPVIWDELKSVN